MREKEKNFMQSRSRIGDDSPSAFGLLRKGNEAFRRHQSGNKLHSFEKKKKEKVIYI